MKDQILTMLELQDAMNRKVHPQWQEQRFEWYRAIWIESAELLDHYGWKWWKKQSPDHDQVTLEIIDIWHFGLSALLQEHRGEREELAREIEAKLKKFRHIKDFRESVEVFVEQVLRTRSFDIEGFATMMRSSDLAFDQLYRSYVGKNVLNFFRQDHGYQNGTYHKTWQGREDNEHLVEVVQQLDASSGSFQQDIYQALQLRYPN